MIGLQWYRQI